LQNQFNETSFQREASFHNTTPTIPPHHKDSAGSYTSHIPTEDGNQDTESKSN